MPSPGFSGGKARRGNGHQERMKLGLIACSSGIGKEPLEPKLASIVEPEGSSCAGEPMQTGFVRFGGISLRFDVLVSLARKMIPTGML